MHILQKLLSPHRKATTYSLSTGLRRNPKSVFQRLIFFEFVKASIYWSSKINGYTSCALAMSEQ